jgi:cyclase
MTMKNTTQHRFGMKRVWLFAAPALWLGACATAGETAQAPAAPPAQAAAATPPAPNTQPFSRVVELGSGISMLIGSGGNLGLSVGEDGALMIDDQYATNAIANLDKIKQLAGDAPRFLVNTHWHFDHAGGNAVFQTAGTTVIAHENARKRLSGEVVSSGRAAQRENAPEAAWPVITFAQGVDFHLNGQTIRAFKVPNAHTDGDVVVQFVEADILHTGDTYMKGRFQFIDTGSGGTLDGLIEAQQLVLSKAGPNTKIIPGHGELATKADLQETNDTIIAARAAVKARVDAGDTLEQAVAAKPLAQWDATYGAGFINSDTFVSTIYGELKK